MTRTTKRCGTCNLWAPNFYKGTAWAGNGCCADALMDLPASWSSKTPMQANDGRDCFLWKDKAA